MSKYQSWFYFGFFFLILCVACEQPVSVNLSQPDKEYVVEGLIMDVPGAYSIKLSLSSEYSQGMQELNIPVEWANVTISDDMGNTELCTQYAPGTYYTSDNFQGVAERSYILIIQTREGDVIMSDPELLTPLPRIKKYYYQFVKAGQFNPAGDRVFVVFDDPGDVVNYYRWRWEGVYQFSTPYQSGIDVGDNSGRSNVCWRYEGDPTGLNIMSDKYFNGKELTLEITLIPYFSSCQYQVTSYLQSLSPGAYQYWNEVKNQISNTGGLLDPPPSRIHGNLHCTSNPAKKVLGYFGASSIFKQWILLNRSNNGIIDPQKIRYYENVPCWELAGSYWVQPDPSTWPPGFR